MVEPYQLWKNCYISTCVEGLIQEINSIAEGITNLIPFAEALFLISQHYRPLKQDEK